MRNESGPPWAVDDAADERLVSLWASPLMARSIRLVVFAKHPQDSGRGRVSTLLLAPGDDQPGGDVTEAEALGAQRAMDSMFSSVTAALSATEGAEPSAIIVVSCQQEDRRRTSLVGGPQVVRQRRLLVAGHGETLAHHSLRPGGSAS
ncbi:hypothetical protein ACBR40_27350 [Nonomuraea sp. AD125B]|uniref:hypothetical protein n=1 Tax=Nonomuraea sp. AD125B TaxID=3242897 RepID=UPI0035295069